VLNAETVMTVAPVIGSTRNLAWRADEHSAVTWCGRRGLDYSVPIQVDTELRPCITPANWVTRHSSPFPSPHCSAI